ncbi:MAG: mycothiol conjugate amidase Mca [bacterium]
MTSPLRLMAVHAHPDDESSKGAATTAHYGNEGVDGMVVTCTGGERGDVLHAGAQAEVDAIGLAEVRRREMAEAARILGVRHEWLGFEDSGYPEGDPRPPLPDGCFAALPLEVASRPLVELVRAFRPHVMTTYDENGGYPHPDHIRCHEVAMEAFTKSGDAGAYPGTGEPWQPAKLYYNMAFTRGRVLRFHEALVAAGMESPYADWLEDWDEGEEDRVTTRVRVDDYFPVRDDALRAHRTQVDPEGLWFAVPLEMQRDLWPTEDFHLAISHVPTDLPEDDLFAGLRGASWDS